MKCRSCDLEVPDEALYCPSCAARVDASESPDLSPTKYDRRPQSPTSPAREDRRKRPPRRLGAPVRPPRAAFEPGKMLADRYRIAGVLGRGGMGVVYRADDLTLEQPVALKFLPEVMEGDPAKLSSLLHEVKIAREIAHPNVCSVYDVGEEDGHHFLSMKYVDGQDLSSLLAQVGRLPKEKGHEIAFQICHGLAAAHEKGVLHRDLKPANLLIDRDGNAFVTDFGLASLTLNLRDDSTIVGTPAYMAPEQHQGRGVSLRTDLYSLGLVLYEIFTGARPFRARTPMELARLHCEVDPPPPSLVAGNIEPAVERMILRCLAKDPGARPSSALEVAEALPGSRGTASPWHPAEGLELPQRANWILERKLGEGGFGEAWCAVHKKTGERRVFKFCFEERSLRTLQREITLFLLLKEKLGNRDDISRILDWSFDTEPYFIESEYTPGGNLIEWAENQGGIEQVPPATRLEIVAQLAEALAAAHSVGVLHKDVKPSNVLITTDAEGRSRPKLTDFGIGIVTDRRRLEEAGLTAAGMTTEGKSSNSGTRLYMAPELLEGKGATLETDVYALGVLLYQLVVGDFSRALVHGWRQDVTDEVLREDIGETVDRSSRKRLKAQQLAERLRQLDERRWLYKKRQAQQKEAEEARVALARAYRRRKLVAGVIAVLLTFGVSISIMAWNLAKARETAHHEAQRANELAQQANEQAERANREALRAQQAASEAQQLTEFLAGVFSVSDLGEMLDRGAGSVGDLRDQPELQARLMHNMGRVYLNLGRHEAAIPLVEDALEMKRELYGPEHVEVAEALEDLASLHRLGGNPEEAERVLRDAIEVRTLLISGDAGLPGDSSGSLASSQHEMAKLLAGRKSYAEAAAFAHQAIASLREDGPEDWRLAEVQSLLGECLVGLGKHAEAEKLLRDAHTVLRIELGESAEATREALRRIVELYEAWGRKAMVVRFRALAERTGASP